jgi:two-component system LytT family sensor kinase
MIWEVLKAFPGIPGASVLHSYNGKERRMNRAWKWLFSLNFEKSFFASFLKLLLAWNPIWTLLLSLLYESGSVRSIFFRWGWSFLEATVVGLFAMAAIQIFLFFENTWLRARGAPSSAHGTGWYLLFLAFMVPFGLYLALHFIVFLINWIFTGDPITPEFHWQYYESEIFWGWMLVLVFFFFKSWEELRETAQLNRIRAEELEKERLQALLTKLKDQMNPHFLFNTLNTVASLIPADPPKAEQVVMKLSALFQAILEATRKTDHPLKKELEFCRDYLDIEKTRFGSRLTTEIKIGSDVDADSFMIPVLILQPLVENAVKHGISSRASGGSVWINASVRGAHLILSVEDDGVGFGNSPYAGSGTALGNCRKRLELEFGNDGKLEIGSREKGGTRILLSIPISRIKISARKENR